VVSLATVHLHWQPPLHRSPCRRCSAIRIGQMTARRPWDQIRIVLARQFSRAERGRLT
jgi:hypothetical protein